MAAASGTAPRLTCGCGAAIEIPGKRIGDSVRCGGCGKLRVVIRSQALGEVPPAVQAGGLDEQERREVQDTLKRIKLRRAGRASRHVALYPSWAVFLAGVQFYLAGILAGQNLISVGQEQRGKRLIVAGIASYLLLGAGLLAVGFLAGHSVPRWVVLPLLLAVPLLHAVWFTAAQHAPTQAAREAGATNAPVLVPVLIGAILAIAQAFAVWFIKLRFDPWS